MGIYRRARCTCYNESAVGPNFERLRTFKKLSGGGRFFGRGPGVTKLRRELGPLRRMRAAAMRARQGAVRWDC